MLSNERKEVGEMRKGKENGSLTAFQLPLQKKKAEWEKLFYTDTPHIYHIPTKQNSLNDSNYHTMTQ
eukprot:m.19499 g.19499  ORF g.19499 m.19499 type:complete len:67 (+) comp12486_c0_seq1:164-364(+)